MENEERFRRIEEAILMMKDLIVSHDERADKQDQGLKDFYAALERERREREESRKDFEFKLDALIDAQIRNEAGITKLKTVSESHLQRIVKLESE